MATNPDFFNEHRWRDIGPYRGGRTKAAAGVPQQPNVFYIGVVNGGVWKTTDYGRTWVPIFDDQPTGSIGAIAVAPSDPNIIYVGSGEGLQRPDLSTGNGIYKSTDAGAPGRTSACATASRSRRSSSIPRDPNRLFVAVLGHPYGPNEERGLYRSTNGGRTFQRVWYRDAEHGRHRRRLRRERPQHAVPGHVGIAAGTVGERRLAGARQRHCSSPPTAATRGRRS